MKLHPKVDGAIGRATFHNRFLRLYSEKFLIDREKRSHFGDRFPFSSKNANFPYTTYPCQLEAFTAASA
ncbi:hypothetical protein [Nostoc sp.]|uniref:hypothetical protein n=1 Tax=Nostoc sp. TaxID=1180 RepID=UPI002FEF50A9